MKTIKEFIREATLLPRVRESGVLVVYDPDGRYRDLCLEMIDETLRVIDAGESSIVGREEALKTLQELGGSGTKLEGMLIYIPAPTPLNEEEKQRDPFAIYGACGRIFPDGDGDEFMSLCLTAKPDYATEIRRIFSDDPNPGFAVIDAVGRGTGWPNLQALLERESPRDILVALLAPNDRQKTALDGQEAWIAETKGLVESCLGMNLMTRGKTWSAVADELWRFVLFSEFVFDLPEELPAALTDVPRAVDEARPLVEYICDQLRNDRRTQAQYIEQAERIESDKEGLNLPVHCADIKNLGNRDTFPFEERCFLEQAAKAVIREDTKVVQDVLARHTHTVWSGTGQSHVQWGLIQSAADLCESCDDQERLLPEFSGSLGALIEFYLKSLRETDRMQRQFEQAVGDCIDTTPLLEEMIVTARSRYRHLTTKVQDLFIRHFEKSSWPPNGHLANVDVFDKLVAPKLQESGRRVAYFLVDALRYELGTAWHKQLSDDGKAELFTAFAQLPSTTLVGMASLLPNAGSELTLQKDGNGVLPLLAGNPLSSVAKRMDVFRAQFGVRFTEIPLSDAVNKKKSIPETVDLLVVRSTEIDAQLETSPESSLGLLPRTLQRIRAAIYRLKNEGFHDIVIATDHGFFLNPQAEAGDVCSKPSGEWCAIHNRLLLGSGSGDAANFMLPAEQVGIKGDFAQVAGPRQLISYRSGERYFHGGVSLQECVVPVLSLTIGQETAAVSASKITIGYKDGAKRITSRFPVFDIQADNQQMDFFSPAQSIDVLLEAHTKKGKVVGEAKAGGPVDPSTGTITLKPNDHIKVTLKMQLEFEGKFTVKVINPKTMAIYCKINLETDYAV